MELYFLQTVYTRYMHFRKCFLWKIFPKCLKKKNEIFYIICLHNYTSYEWLFLYEWLEPDLTRLRTHVSCVDRLSVDAALWQMCVTETTLQGLRTIVRTYWPNHLTNLSPPPLLPHSPSVPPRHAIASAIHSSLNRNSYNQHSHHATPLTAITLEPTAGLPPSPK